MSSLLESKIAAQASDVTDITSGAVARESDPATLPQDELSRVASGTKIAGGKRRRSSKRRGSKAKKGSKARKSNRRRRSSRSYRRPLFML